MEREQHPFVFGRLAGVNNFTDREADTERLIGNFNTLTNTILISPRRFGKSSLVVHATAEAARRDKNLRYCIIDLFSVRNEEEFCQKLAEQVLKTTANKSEDMLRLAGKYLKQFVPKLSMSAENSDVSVSMNWEEVKKSPDELLNLAEKAAAEKKIKLIICIDEFQNIGMFSDPLAFQKRLRSAWQRHKHVAYCLYGSKRNMMMEVFASPSMPFYKFGDLHFLDKISENDWKTFIVKRFRDTGKNIQAQDAIHIAQLTENHSFYVQQVSQLSWLRTKKTCTRKEIDDAFSSLIDQLSMLFQSMTDDLSNTQVNFLAALIDGVEQLSAKQTLYRYRLGTSANVLRIKDALLDKEIIDMKGNRPYILDPLYKAWLKKFYFKGKTWN